MSYENIFEETKDFELEAWRNFKARYMAHVPPPQQVRATIWKTIGWQIVAVGIQAFGAIGLAALRTAEMFYIASASQATAIFEAVFSLVAIEFGIVVFAAIRAEHDNRNLSDTKKVQALKISLPWLITGEIIMLIISIMAGIGVSAKGFDVDIQNLALWLTYTLGAGASIVAAIAGMVIGTMLARWGNIQDVASRKYQAEYTKWEEALNKSWNASPDKKIVMNDIRRLKQEMGSTVRSVRKSNERTNIKRDAIIAYMRENTTDEFLPGPSHVARELGFSKGYVSDVLKSLREEAEA